MKAASELTVQGTQKARQLDHRSVDAVGSIGISLALVPGQAGFVDNPATASCSRSLVTEVMVNAAIPSTTSNSGRLTSHSTTHS